MNYLERIFVWTNMSLIFSLINTHRNVAWIPLLMIPIILLEWFKTYNKNKTTENST